MLKKIEIIIITIVIIASLIGCGLEDSKTGKDGKNSNDTKKARKIDDPERKAKKASLKISQGNFDKLESYRMKANFNWKTDNNTQINTTSDITYSKKNKSKKIKVTNSAINSSTEMVNVGNNVFISINGKWHRSSKNKVNSSYTTDDYMDFVHGIKNISKDYKYINNEKIEGIKCKKYSIDGCFDVPIPQQTLSKQSTVTKNVKIKGDMWVAYEKGMEGVIVKEVSRLEGMMINPVDLIKEKDEAIEKNTVLTTERLISNINEGVVVEAPDGNIPMEEIELNEIGLPELIELPEWLELTETHENPDKTKMIEYGVIK